MWFLTQNIFTAKDTFPTMCSINHRIRVIRGTYRGIAMMTYTLRPL